MQPPRTRMPTPDADAPPEGTATVELDWESRALARVAGHFRELTGSPAGSDSGWETSTVTLLDGYFSRTGV